MRFFKLPFVFTLVAALLGSMQASGQSIQSQLDALLSNQPKLSNAATLLQPYYDGAEQISVVVTVKPSQAARALEKPLAGSNAANSNAYGNVNYNLSDQQDRQALATVVNETLSAFLLSIQSIGSQASPKVEPIRITNQFK